MAETIDRRDVPSPAHPKREPATQGTLVVDARKNADVTLYYELHGNGDKKILFISGIHTIGIPWDEQLDFFASHPEYQCCVFDNRGCGRSSAPKGIYSTARMARDVTTLLGNLNWSLESTHVVGACLGGMIALEMAVESAAMRSLTLISTHAGGKIPLFSKVRHCSNLIFEKNEDRKVYLTAQQFYPIAWLNTPKRDVDGSQTNFQALRAATLQRNAALPKQEVGGLIGQTAAAMRHKISRSNLAAIGRKGYPILIVTGSDDKVVPASYSDRLGKPLNGQVEVFEGSGHAVQSECADRLNDMLLSHFRKADVAAGPEHAIEPERAETTAGHSEVPKQSDERLEEQVANMDIAQKNKLDESTEPIAPVASTGENTGPEEGAFKTPANDKMTMGGDRDRHSGEHQDNESHRDGLAADKDLSMEAKAESDSVSTPMPASLAEDSNALTLDSDADAQRDLEGSPASLQDTSSPAFVAPDEATPMIGSRENESSEESIDDNRNKEAENVLQEELNVAVSSVEVAVSSVEDGSENSRIEESVLSNVVLRSVTDVANPDERTSASDEKPQEREDVSTEDMLPAASVVYESTMLESTTEYTSPEMLTSSNVNSRDANSGTAESPLPEADSTHIDEFKTENLLVVEHIASIESEIVSALDALELSSMATPATTASDDTTARSTNGEQDPLLADKSNISDKDTPRSGVTDYGSMRLDEGSDRSKHDGDYVVVENDLSVLVESLDITAAPASSEKSISKAEARNEAEKAEERYLKECFFDSLKLNDELDGGKVDPALTESLPLVLPVSETDLMTREIFSEGMPRMNDGKDVPETAGVERESERFGDAGETPRDVVRGSQLEKIISAIQVNQIITSSMESTGPTDAPDAVKVEKLADENMVPVAKDVDAKHVMESEDIATQEPRKRIKTDTVLDDAIIDVAPAEKLEEVKEVKEEKEEKEEVPKDEARKSFIDVVTEKAANLVEAIPEVASAASRNIVDSFAALSSSAPTREADADREGEAPHPVVSESIDPASEHPSNLAEKIGNLSRTVETRLENFSNTIKEQVQSISNSVTDTLDDLRSAKHVSVPGQFEVSDVGDIFEEDPLKDGEGRNKGISNVEETATVPDVPVDSNSDRVPTEVSQSPTKEVSSDKKLLDDFIRSDTGELPVDRFEPLMLAARNLSSSSAIDAENVTSDSADPVRKDQDLRRREPRGVSVENEDEEDTRTPVRPGNFGRFGYDMLLGDDLDDMDPDLTPRASSVALHHPFVHDAPKPFEARRSSAPVRAGSKLFGDSEEEDPRGSSRFRQVSNDGGVIGAYGGEVDRFGGEEEDEEVAGGKEGAGARDVTSRRRAMTASRTTSIDDLSVYEDATSG